MPELQDKNFYQVSLDFRSWFVAFGGITNQTIVIDDVLVTATGCDDVPVEPSTWGAVKAGW